MKYVGAVLVLVVGAVCTASATEDRTRVDAAGEQLGQSLSELKNSVGRLAAGNEALAAANARLKTQLDVLRLRLKGLMAEEDRMSGEADQEAEDPSARKEKLKILKMIDDSKQVQQQL